MKIITFKKLSIKNFFSIGSEPIEITFKEGVNYITGENLDVINTKNAIGKSSIIDAFNFAIFGSSLRRLNKEQIVNNLSTGSTEVILQFNCNSPKGNNDFKIIRTLNPSNLYVEKDGRDKTRDSIPNTNKYIAEVLSAAQDVFKNCIIMRANNTISFMDQGKTEKKKFIEGIFNLDVITRMFKSVKDDINLSKHDLDIESKLFEQINTNIRSYEEKLSSQLKLKDESSLKISTSVSALEDKILKLETENNSITILEDGGLILQEQIAIEDLNKAKQAQIKISVDLGNNKYEEKVILKELTAISSRGIICDECKRPFQEDDIEKTEQEIKKLNAKLDNIKVTINKLLNFQELSNKVYLNKQQTLSNIKDSIYNNLNLKKKILRNKELIKAYRDNLLNLKNAQKESDFSNTKVLEELLENTNSEKKEKDNIIKDINQNLTKLEVARFILSEEGIRAYIIKKLLDLLNFRIKYYLSKQNSQYSLVFNELFEDEIINKKGILVSYGNLSGAEAKFLDLACIWSFRDILKLQGSVSYNVAFYDEILDSSMDETNSGIICDILNEFASKEKMSIYLISHKSDFIKAVTGEIVHLQKSKGITTRITK